MAWKRGTMPVISPARGEYYNQDVLVNGDVTISLFDPYNEVSRFSYESNVARFSFSATRFYGTHDLSDTWVVYTDMWGTVAKNRGEEYLRVHKAQFIQDITEVLMTDLGPPLDFGRPDVPVRHVCFTGSFADEFERFRKSGLLPEKRRLKNPEP